MNIAPEIIVAIIGGIVAVLAAILTNLFMRKKNDADASKAISQAVVLLINPLKDRIHELEIDEAKIKHHLALVLVGVRKLINQIRQQGCEPVWTPDEVAADLAADLAAKLAAHKSAGVNAGE